MGDRTEEEFSMDHIPNFGNLSNMPSNYSDQIQKMIDILHNFEDHIAPQSNYVLLGLYVPVIPVAIFANILVIAVVFKKDYMRSPTNYFVVNLSIADLLVTILCMPMAMAQAISIVGLYNEIVCKIIFYLQGVAVSASVLTITVMSIDRYMAIKNPITFRRSVNQRRISAVIFVIWLASFVIFIPILKAVRMSRPDEHDVRVRIPIASGKFKIVVFKPPPISICFEDLPSLGIDPSHFGVTCFLLVFAIPVSVILVVYVMMGRTLYARRPPLDADCAEGSAGLQQRFRLVRERKRVAWILLILAVLFTLCWFPYNVLRLLVDLGFFVGKNWVGDTLPYCLFFGHMNSMLNPLVYCFMTRTFRRSISELLCYRNLSTEQHKSHRNTLAVGVCAFSSRGTQNRTVLNQITTYPARKIHRSLSSQLEFAQTQGATTSTTCRSSSSRHSSHWRCRSFNATYQNPKFVAVLKESRVCSQNDLPLPRSRSHTEIREKRLNGSAMLNKRQGETLSNRHSK